MIRREKRLAIGVGATVGVLAVVLTAGAISANTEPSRSGESSVGGNATATADSGSGETRLSVEVGGVNWTVSRTDGPDEACIGVVATLHGEELGSLGGGCGRPEIGHMRFGIGGIDIGGDWFNLAYGEVAPETRSLDVILGDGTVLRHTVVPEAEGLWIVVSPGQPTSLGSDFVLIKALDAGGSVIAQETPPSLVARRLQAQASVAVAEAGSGDT